MQKLITPFLIFLLLILSRYMSEIPNFTPTLALILFSNYFISNKYTAIFTVLISQFVADMYIGMYSYIFFVYLSYVIIILVGEFYLKELRFKSVIISSFLAASIFFIISNFGFWFSESLYGNDLNGLIACYVAAIPFFDDTLISSSLYSVTIYIVCRFSKNLFSQTNMVKK
tara:strand:+ start:2217 stop:2729 length:513 start_codon:yes stop_codon:yes gene_type:complete